MLDRIVDAVLLIFLLVAVIIVVDGASNKTEISQRTASIRQIEQDAYCVLVRDGKPHYKIERDCR